MLAIRHVRCSYLLWLMNRLGLRTIIIRINAALQIFIVSFKVFNMNR